MTLCLVPNVDNPENVLLCDRETGHDEAHGATDDRGGRWRWFGGHRVCEAPHQPGHPESMTCDQPLDHPGPHRNLLQGAGWPREKRSVNQVVADTVAMHAAQARLDHSRAVAALEGMPTLSQAARQLRARRERLKSEAEAWGEIEAYIRGERP